MSVLTLLVECLYLLSVALLVPVILGLMGLLIWTLLELGGFLRELRERRRRGRASQLAEVGAGHAEGVRNGTASSCYGDAASAGGLVGWFLRRATDAKNDPLRLQKALADLEVEAARRLARMSVGIRIGPALGLMGTLIPMGPALIGLSTGNIDEMAHNLVVAFSTTVLGLFIGGCCYVMWLVRRHWYSQDLVDCEYLLQRMTEQGERSDESDRRPAPIRLQSAPTPSGRR